MPLLNGFQSRQAPSYATRYRPTGVPFRKTVRSTAAAADRAGRHDRTDTCAGGAEGSESRDSTPKSLRSGVLDRLNGTRLGGHRKRSDSMEGMPGSPNFTAMAERSPSKEPGASHAICSLADLSRNDRGVPKSESLQALNGSVSLIAVPSFLANDDMSDRVRAIFPHCRTLPPGLATLHCCVEVFPGPGRSLRTSTLCLSVVSPFFAPRNAPKARCRWSPSNRRRLPATRRGGVTDAGVFFQLPVGTAPQGRGVGRKATERRVCTLGGLGEHKATPPAGYQLAAAIAPNATKRANMGVIVLVQQ